MLTKTKGIVIRTTHYGDSSVIVSAFTESEGLQSYMVKGARRSRKDSRMALFQPLTILELVVYQRPQSRLHHLREVKCLHPYRNLHQDIRRESIAFFIAEVLNRVLREQSQPEETYSFLEESLIRLDTINDGLEDFHLHFLLRLCRHLGFGAGTSADIAGAQALPAEVHSVLQDLIDGKPARLNSSIRRDLLNLLIRYLQRHIEDFGQIRSVDVLREVLN